MDLWPMLSQLRWGPQLLPPGHPDLDRDEPPNVLADEPPPDLPDGWTYQDYLAHIRAGGSPRPEQHKEQPK